MHGKIHATQQWKVIYLHYCMDQRHEDVGKLAICIVNLIVELEVYPVGKET